jgi:transposase
MPRPFGAKVDLVEQARANLEALVRAGSTPQALVFRCRIVLLAAAEDAPSNQNIAAELGCNRHTVGQWRERFAQRGLPGLQDAPRSGRPRKFSPR